MTLWVAVAVLGCLTLASGRAEAEGALASWYGPGFAGQPTATGEPYDPAGFTAASKTLPLGTDLLVSYGGNSVGVTVNDRGPYVGDRGLDLSEGAAQALGLTEAGVDYVQYTPVGQEAASSDASTAQYSSTTSSTTQYDQYDPGTASTDPYAATAQYATADPASIGATQSVAPEPATAPAATVSDAPDAGAPPPVAYPPDPASTLLVVSPGETLSGISAETGVSVADLAARNAISDPDVIYAGQVLYY